MKSIIINYPEDFVRTISSEEEDSYVISKNLVQEILDYLLAKLGSFSFNIKSSFKSDILSSYKVYCNKNVDLFLSIRSIYKEKSEYNWACIQYFNSPLSSQYVENVVYRLKKIKFDDTPLFNQVISKKEEGIPDGIPNIICSFCFNNYGIGFYNIDKDSFITQISENILYGIMDQIEQFDYKINLKEFSD